MSGCEAVFLFNSFHIHIVQVQGYVEPVAELPASNSADGVGPPSASLKHEKAEAFLQASARAAFAEEETEKSSGISISIGV